jgi:hypothetical protein
MNKFFRRGFFDKLSQVNQAYPQEGTTSLGEKANKMLGTAGKAISKLNIPTKDISEKWHAGKENFYSKILGRPVPGSDNFEKYLNQSKMSTPGVRKS